MISTNRKRGKKEIARLIGNIQEYGQEISALLFHHWNSPLKSLWTKEEMELDQASKRDKLQ